MQRLKRLFYYLLINILVSACTTLVVLQVLAAQQQTAGSSIPMLFPAWGAGTPVTTTLTAPAQTVVVTALVTVIPEMSPYPTCGIVSYTVRAGDTMSSIASMFGVTVDDILVLNSLRNPDRVVEGWVLLIPPMATPAPTATITLTPTPWQTPTPQATPTPQQSPTPNGPTAEPDVTINVVIGAGDLASERVELKVGGGGQVSLSEWLLRDENGNVFTFPQLTLYAGATISVYSRAGQNTVTALYWGLTQPIWQSGETATLVDAEGNVQAEYVIP